MITLFMLPGGTDMERVRCARSMSGVAPSVKVVELKENVFDVHWLGVLDTPWYFMLYGYEYLDNNLKLVIPRLFFRTTHFFLFHKKEMIGKKTKLSIAPRMFRDFVKLRPDCLLPQNENLLVRETILDGWIRC